MIWNRRGAAIFGLFFLFVAAAGQTVDFSAGVLINRGGRFFDIVAAMVPPDITYAETVLGPLWSTIQMSVVGTAVGAVMGMLGAFFANSYINSYISLRIFFKGIIHFIRTIPVLIIALICTFLFGLGTLAGTIALAVYTFAVMTRMGYEDMENMSLTTARALEATGCGKVRAFIRTILPGILPGYMTNLLYLLEANVRHAAILGYVGAGGIGLLLNEKLAWREYSQVGMILVLLYMVVLMTESVSEWLRRILEGKRRINMTCKWGLGTAFFVLFISSVCTLQFPGSSSSGFSVAGSIVNGLFHPDINMLLSVQRDGILYLMYETLCIAFLGTLGGAVIAAWFSFSASFRLLPTPIALLSRLFLLLIRTIPVFVYGLMWIRVTGPGAFAGVMTLSVCSVGLLAKRFLIAIDDIDLKPYDAYTAMGIPLIGRLQYALLPQLYSRYTSAILYRLDVNIRDAAALGLVGAGGIGTPLILAMMHYSWSEAGALLWGMIILVTVVEGISEWSRKKSTCKI